MNHEAVNLGVRSVKKDVNVAVAGGLITGAPVFPPVFPPGFLERLASFS